MADQNDKSIEVRTNPQKPSWGRERHKAIAEADLDPLSLVGSYFHKLEDGEIVWQGLVVGEPNPGVYLCEIWDSIEGCSRSQRVISNRMIAEPSEGHEWRFYDNEDWMRGAFAEWTTHQEREIA